MQRMLIVDDERDVCECLQDFFSTHGFSVHAAFSGEEALEHLEHEPADVVLLDILLPGLSGIEVLRRMRACDHNVRIVMVSSIDQTDIRAQAKNYGADAYVTKPFDFSPQTWSAVLAP